MKPRRVAILFNRVAPDASRDDLDVLDQVRLVAGALSELGFAPAEVPLTLDLDWAAKRLRRLRPWLVFNLAESVGGDGKLVHLAPALLDHLRLPYTGCPTEAMFLTCHKVWAKRVLDAGGVPTPEWLHVSSPAPESLPAGHYIVKSVWEHASAWFDEQAIRPLESVKHLAGVLRQKKEQTGQEFYAERYIDGREFNVAVLAGTVLPIPEMRFLEFPPERFKVVDYRAKWDEASFEYTHTVAGFDFPPEDGPLLQTLGGLARRCWDLFGLRGYARVDFRVDPDGRPWVMEVNANPCISPDAGFIRAARRAGLSDAGTVGGIVDDALARFSLNR